MDDFSEFSLDFRSQFFNQDIFSFIMPDNHPACANPGQTATCQTYEQPTLQTGSLIELGVPTSSTTVFDSQVTYNSNWNMIGGLNGSPEPKSLYHQEADNHHKNIQKYHCNFESPELIPPPPYRPPNGFDLESLECSRKTPPPPYSLANKNSRTNRSTPEYHNNSAKDNSNNNLAMDNFQSLDNFCTGQFELNQRINNFQKDQDSPERGDFLRLMEDFQNLNNSPHAFSGDSPNHNASGLVDFTSPPVYDSRNLTPSPLSDAMAWTDPDSPPRRDGSPESTGSVFPCGEGTARGRPTSVPNHTVEDAGEGGWRVGRDDVVECMSEGKCLSLFTCLEWVLIKLSKLGKLIFEWRPIVMKYTIRPCNIKILFPHPLIIVSKQIILIQNSQSTVK